MRFSAILIRRRIESSMPTDTQLHKASHLGDAKQVSLFERVVKNCEKVMWDFWLGSVLLRALFCDC